MRSTLRPPTLRFAASCACRPTRLALSLRSAARSHHAEDQDHRHRQSQQPHRQRRHPRADSGHRQAAPARRCSGRRSLLPLLRRNSDRSGRQIPNLIVARTFSKAYGLASLRLGLLAGLNRTLTCAGFAACSRPTASTRVALVASPRARRSAYLDWYVSEVKQAARRILSGQHSTEIGLRYWPTEANFVLVDIGIAHAEFVTAMREQGILVRDRSADPGCDGSCASPSARANKCAQAFTAIASIQSFLKLTGVSQ
jgi:hypothetical protein